VPNQLCQLVPWPDIRLITSAFFFGLRIPVSPPRESIHCLPSSALHTAGDLPQTDAECPAGVAADDARVPGRLALGDLLGLQRPSRRQTAPPLRDGTHLVDRQLGTGLAEVVGREHPVQAVEEGPAASCHTALLEAWDCRVDRIDSGGAAEGLDSPAVDHTFVAFE
jgi:hypothetical protein